ncbi:MAG: hypothetical protein ACRDT4_06050 [Micromonosporaceae bacterium]
MGIRRALGAVTLVAAVMASGIVAAAGPAYAASYAKLTITPVADEPGNYLVCVSGHYDTNTRQTTVGWRLYGDDVYFDDYLGVIGSGEAYYGDFGSCNVVWKRALNEDPEGRDEIYARVGSSTGWSAETPNVYGYY